MSDEEHSTLAVPVPPLLPDVALEIIATFCALGDVGRLGSISKARFAAAVGELRWRLAHRTAGRAHDEEEAPGQQQRIAAIEVEEKEGGALAAKGWAKMRFLVELGRRVKALEEEYARDPRATVSSALAFRANLERRRCLGCEAEMPFRLGRGAQRYPPLCPRLAVGGAVVGAETRCPRSDAPCGVAIVMRCRCACQREGCPDFILAAARPPRPGILCASCAALESHPDRCRFDLPPWNPGRRVCCRCNYEADTYVGDSPDSEEELHELLAELGY